MKNYNKLNKAHQKYFSALCMYGIIVMQKTIDLLVLEERYEMAQLAKETIEGYCEIYRLDVPKPITDIEDYKLEFWRLGLSGDTAVNNLPYYIQCCYNEIISQKKPSKPQTK